MKRKLLVILIFIVLIFSMIPIVESTESDRIIYFAGHFWKVRSSSSLEGPGKNYYSDSEENVWVDHEGLHLKITENSGKWYCAEIISCGSFGYGKYTFYLDGRPDNFNENVVLGLFTYFEDINDGNDIIEPEKGEGEIDIEISKWGNSESAFNLQYVLQPAPYIQNVNLHRFLMTLNGDYSTHYFNWQSSSVYFKSMHGHYDDTNDPNLIITHKTLSGDNVPHHSEEKVHLNLWLCDTNDDGIGDKPTDNQEVEIIIKDISFPDVEPDPFNYVGNYVLDSNKLTNLENEAVQYVHRYALSESISPALVMATISKESSFDPNALYDDFINYYGNLEPRAIGYMQLWWPSAYDAGYRGIVRPIEGELEDLYVWFNANCYDLFGQVTPTLEKFYAYLDWPTDGLDPEANIMYGCRFIRILYNWFGLRPEYGDALRNVISAYQAGAPDPDNEDNIVNPRGCRYEYYKSKYIENPIYKGLNYLKSSQNSDGSWSNNVGITALCTLAFLNYGFTEEDAVVSNAINWFLSYVRPDGSIYGYGKTYETSMAMLALIAADKTNNPKKYTSYINNAKNWLVSSQWDESCLWGSVNTNSWYYGGFGYGSHSRPDLSNTQWAMMALQAAGATNENSDNVWTKSIIHANRCQARDVTNDQSWANGRTSGGFIYTAGGYAPWGGSINGYGSMTAAGLWSLLLSGVPSNDPRIENNAIPYGAIDWFENLYTWEVNPGGTGYNSRYYFYVSMAKALTMAGKTKLVVGGTSHDWYNEMSDKIISLQHSSGYWQGNSYGWENNKDLATAYALLALQTRELPVGADLWMSIILASYADLHLYDNQGRHTGKLYNEDGTWTGEIESEIPGSSYELVNGKQIINVSQLVAGTYRIELVGTGVGEYNLTILGFDGESELYNESYIGMITDEEIHSTDAIITAMEGALTIFTFAPELSPVMHIEPEVLEIASGYGSTFQESFIISSEFNDTHGILIYATDMIDEFGNVIGGENFGFSPNGFTVIEDDSTTVEVTGTIPIIPGGGWTYTGQFIIESSDAGTKTIDVTILMDSTPPTINIIVPIEGQAIQDGVTFEAEVSDPSGVDWVTFSIRLPDGGTGIVIDPAYESMPAIDMGGDSWQLIFDTTMLPDGYYLLLCEACDIPGNQGYETVEFSIRNWAVVELLPSTTSSKAGRTMPIKFSIRVVGAVDPAEPFVWNEDLTILIYKEGHPENILQNSAFGDTSKDYRINSESELYITNFKTSKKPTTYVVEIWRKDMLLDSFQFETVK